MMNRTFLLSILLVLTTVLSLVFAQNHTEKPNQNNRNILIVKDSSNLEISVSRIIRDSLTRKGYSVKEVPLAEVNKEKASLYNISIVFNAINTVNDVDPRVQKFITTKSGTESRVLLYTVYGKIYDKKSDDVDATTAASQALHPQLIANQILWSLKL